MADEPLTREDIYKQYDESKQQEEKDYFENEMGMKPEEMEEMYSTAKELSEKDTAPVTDTDDGEDEEKEKGKEEKLEAEGSETETEVEEKGKETQTEQDSKTGDFLDLQEYGARKLKTKVDGVEGEVTIADLIKSHQLEKHLTQKGQQLADQQRQFQMQQQQFAQYVQQMQAQMRQPQYGHPDPADEYLTEEEKRIKNITQRQELLERQNRQMIQWFSGQNQLTQVHPDAMQLDQDPDFQRFMSTKIPMINKQFVDYFGPQVLIPAMTLYKEHKWLTEMVNSLEQSRSEAENNAALLTKERDSFLQNREADQQKQKRKAADIKPSTSIEPDEGTRTGDDDEAESPRDYLRKLKKARETAQGIR